MREAVRISGVNFNSEGLTGCNPPLSRAPQPAGQSLVFISAPNPWGTWGIDLHRHCLCSSPCTIKRDRQRQAPH
jgi:hypothetical protein